MKKNMVLTYLILSLIGIGLISGAVLAFVDDMHFRQSAAKITGNIADITSYYDSDGDVHHEVFVTYMFEGERYERVRLSEYNSTMHVGGNIALLCDPENPEKVKTESGIYIAVIVLAIMGISFFGVGTILLIISIKKRIQRKYLIENGRVLHATVERIDLNRNISINSQNPYIIYCTWKDEYADTLYRFKSDNLWTDPSPVFYKGSEIDVCVDAKDFSKYYVDAQQILSQRAFNFKG